MKFIRANYSVNTVRGVLIAKERRDRHLARVFRKEKDWGGPSYFRAAIFPCGAGDGGRFVWSPPPPAPPPLLGCRYGLLLISPTGVAS